MMTVHHRHPAPKSWNVIWCGLLSLGLISPTPRAIASDLTIHMANSSSYTHKVGKYQCDSTGVELGLPPGPFTVEYINGGGNSLAVLPIANHSLIFAGVVSGSGARYAAQQYIWWEAAGRSISLTSDSLDGKKQAFCQPVKQ
jgi:membrane-bound inhibitor of C-type lysozyme